MSMITIDILKKLKESKDKVEFKKGEGGNISYDGSSKAKPSDSIHFERNLSRINAST